MSLPERIASLPVVLRPLEFADAKRVAELCGDWEVARMTALIPHPYPLESAASFITACHEPDPNGPACTSADAGESLGYWIGRPYWGNGYATAAARAIIALTFSQSDIEVLTAIHLVENPASGRVMAKCGMSELRREMRSHRDGAPMEFRVWTIDRDAWERATGGPG